VDDLELPLFLEESHSLKPVDIPIVTPLIIRQAPIIRNDTVMRDIWRKLIIDTKLAASYTEEIPPQNQDHSMVLSLASWSDLRKFNALTLTASAQRAKKLFLHFPLVGRSKCPHECIVKMTCDRPSCGLIAPFRSMQAITSSVNNYMAEETTTGVLLYCHDRVNRMLLFTACCMIQGGTPLSKVMGLVRRHQLVPAYQKYIREFATYLDRQLRA
jgi:hypothetical protein